MPSRVCIPWTPRKPLTHKCSHQTWPRPNNILNTIHSHYHSKPYVILSQPVVRQMPLTTCPIPMLSTSLYSKYHNTHKTNTTNNLNKIYRSIVGRIMPLTAWPFSHAVKISNYFLTKKTNSIYAQSIR